MWVVLARSLTAAHSGEEKLPKGPLCLQRPNQHLEKEQRP